VAPIKITHINAMIKKLKRESEQRKVKKLFEMTALKIRNIKLEQTKNVAQEVRENKNRKMI
jgi:hypothetical protein